MPEFLVSKECSGPNCTARVIWAAHERTGKRMACEVETVTTGTRFTLHDVMGKDRWYTAEGDEPGHPAHWPKCPDAERFRGKRK